MKLGLTGLEVFYLLLGTGILGNEIILTQSLTATELGGALFFFGLTAASKADRDGTAGPTDFIRAVTSIFRPGSTTDESERRERGPQK